MNRRAHISFFRDSLIGSILISGLIFWSAALGSGKPAATIQPSRGALTGTWNLTSEGLHKFGRESTLVLKSDGSCLITNLPGEIVDGSPGSQPRSGPGSWRLSSGGNTWQLDIDTNARNWHEGLSADVLGDEPPYQLAFTGNLDLGHSAIFHRPGDIESDTSPAGKSLEPLLIIGGLLALAIASYQGFCFLITNPGDEPGSPEMSIPEFGQNSRRGCALGFIVAPCSLFLMFIIGQNALSDGDVGGPLLFPFYAIFGGLIGVISPAIGYMTRYFLRWIMRMVRG